MKNLFRKRIPLPGWLFVAAMAIFGEVMLHLWTTDSIVPGRFAAVAVLALAFGALLALLTSFIPGRAQKWVAVVLSLALAVLYLAEYFMIDAYKNYMSLSTMFARAGDVMGGFTDTVITLLSQNVWRICLMLLPVLLFAVVAEGRNVTWKLRGILAGAAAVLYLLGFGIVHAVGTDVDRLDKAYNFDSAVRSFGLHVGLGLDMVRGSGSGDTEPEFVTIQQTTPPTEATEAPMETAATEATEAAEPTEPPVVYEAHAFDLDYAALAESAVNPNVASIHSYVASLEPAMENEYTGLFEGKNLIFITAEAFSAEVIDPERTPTLYRLATEGIRFTDYYQPVWGGSTTTGEFTNLVGLVPIGGGSSMLEVTDQDMFLLMGKQLQKLGYSATGYHNHTFTYYSREKTHTHLGLDEFIAVGNGMEEGITLTSPESDLEMIDFTLPKHLGDEPFYLYYMTMSGHATYFLDGHAMARKNYDVVKDLPYSETVKCYLAANMELEYALESMVRQLEEAGLAEDTVIVLATDHYPYGLERSDAWGNQKDYLAELYGQSVTDNMVRDHSALIIWSGSIEDMDIVVDTPVYSLDILPTLSNLFGLEYDSRLLVGRDVFSDDQPLVLWPTYSWKTDKGSFDSSTGLFTPVDGEEVDEEYVAYIKDLVANKMTFSKAVQNNDYYDELLAILEAE